MTTGAPPPSVGAHLRALRLERQGSLDDMAQATRVSVRQLAALEADDWKELPAPVFVKGFIRSYCHHLDVPPDEALDLYRTMLGEPPITVSALPRPTDPARGFRASPVVISIALLVIFGGGLLALKAATRRGAPPPGSPVAREVRVEPVTTPAAPAAPVVVSAPIAP